MYLMRLKVKIVCVVTLLLLCLLVACNEGQVIKNEQTSGRTGNSTEVNMNSTDTSIAITSTNNTSVVPSTVVKGDLTHPKIIDVSDLNIKAEDIIFIDKELWYVNSEGISKYNLDANKNTVLKKTSDYNKIYYTDGNIWFSNYGLFDDSQAELVVPLLRYNLGSKKFIDYSAEQLQGSSNLVVFGDSSKVWIGGGSTLACLNLSDNSFTFLDNPGESISCIVANSKHTWFSTLDAGIKDMTGDRKVSTYDSSNDLLDNFVSSLLLNKEKLWVNWGGEGESAGLSYMDLEKGKWKHYIGVAGSNFDESKVDKDLEGFTGYAWLDDSSVLWAIIQTDTSEELRKFSDKDNKWVRISLNGKSINTAISNGKYDLIGSTNGLGVFDIDTNKSEWVIKDNEIKKIFRKGKNSFILVTSDGIKEVDFN